MNDFLQDSEGNSSLVRLIPFILCLASILFGLIGVLTHNELGTDMAQVFLAATTGGLVAKVVQKPFEQG
jgi:ABC-type methionine transport system permease subunit